MKDFKVGDQIKLVVNVGPCDESQASGGVRKGDILTCVHDPEPLEGYRLGNGKVSCEWANCHKDYFEEKVMTKGDLKTGMRVVTADGWFGICLLNLGGERMDIVASGNDYLNIDSMKDDMTCEGATGCTVVEVYAQPSNRRCMLDPDVKGELLWKRETKSPAQIELESLQMKISELQDQATKLQELISK